MEIVLVWSSFWERFYLSLSGNNPGCICPCYFCCCYCCCEYLFVCLSWPFFVQLFFRSVVFSEVKDVHNEYRLANRAYLISKKDYRARCHINAVVWPSPYACAQPYHPGRYQATMDSCFGLISITHLISTDIFRWNKEPETASRLSAEHRNYM